jgi:uncharacterized protein YdeI (YjbR/CyaY-like superfamily)
MSNSLHDIFLENELGEELSDDTQHSKTSAGVASVAKDSILDSELFCTWCTESGLNPIDVAKGNIPQVLKKQRDIVAHILATFKTVKQDCYQHLLQAGEFTIPTLTQAERDELKTLNTYAHELSDSLLTKYYAVLSIVEEARGRPAKHKVAF